MTKNELKNIGPALKRGLMESWSKFARHAGLSYIILSLPGEHP